MNVLVQKFTQFATAVFALIMGVRTKFEQGLALANQNLTTFQNTVNGTLQGINTFIGTVPTLISTAKDEAVAYTNQVKSELEGVIASLNFNMFGGRTAAQWETLITATTAAAIAAEEARVNAMKRVSQMKVVKLADHAGTEVPFSSISFDAPVLGETVTQMYKFQGDLGQTQVKRTLMGLPGGNVDIEVDNGDEVFVTYDATGAVAILTFNDTNAAVISSVLGTQVTHTSSITSLETDVAALAAEMDVQRAVAEQMLASLN